MGSYGLVGGVPAKVNCVVVGVIKEGMDDLKTLVLKENIPHTQSGVAVVLATSLQVNVLLRDAQRGKCQHYELTNAEEVLWVRIVGQEGGVQSEDDCRGLG